LIFLMSWHSRVGQLWRAASSASCTTYVERKVCYYVYVYVCVYVCICVCMCAPVTKMIVQDANP